MTSEKSTGSAMEIAEQVAETLLRTFVDAGMSGQRAKPALKAKQGKRTTYMLSLPIGELLELAILRDDRPEEETTNRTVTDNWVRSIERGLRRKLAQGRDDARYVIFPLTGTIDENVTTFRSLYNQPGLADIGLLIMPQSLRVEIADGQHRIVALRTLVKDMPWLRDEAVDLFLIEESDTLQQRTDFADAAKVLPINVSLQAWFDSGVSLNRATHTMVSNSKMINDSDVEKFKATVSGRRNTKIWTYNSLRGYIGSSLVRGLPQKTEDLAERFEDEIANLGWDPESTQMKEYIAQVTSYLDIALEETAGTPLENARKTSNLVDWDEIRAKSWLLKPAGLGAFGLLIHDLRQQAKKDQPGDEHGWVEERVREVSRLDWGYGSAVFKGSLVKGGKTQGSSTAVSHAAIVLGAKLGTLDGIPRRTADSLLELYESGELASALSPDEKNAIRMAKRDS